MGCRKAGHLWAPGEGGAMSGAPPLPAKQCQPRGPSSRPATSAHAGPTPRGGAARARPGDRWREGVARGGGERGGISPGRNPRREPFA